MVVWARAASRSAVDRDRLPDGVRHDMHGTQAAVLPRFIHNWRTAYKGRLMNRITGYEWDC